MMTLNWEDTQLGGPGLDGYTWRADVYCVQCGRAISDAIFAARDGLPMPYPEALDSWELPQPIFFGESDTAEHCADCGAYLYGEESHEDD